MNRVILSILVVLSLLTAFVAAAGYYVFHQLGQTTPIVVVFDIESGSNLYEITDRLVHESVIEVDDTVLKAYALLTRNQGTIKAGQYEVSDGLDVPGLLSLLRSGRVMQHQVTFPEGWTFTQWRQRLSEQPFMSHETTGFSRSDIAQVLGISGDPEGWLFPDTYTYTKGDSDLEILLLAYQKMQEELDAAWQRRGPVTGVHSPYDALILASVIEKETGYEPDRAKIASVFQNRLAIGMKLQSDPTIIYGLGDSFDGDLKRSHLRTDQPYNSYTRPGLPPTPICSPGRASLEAALAGSMHPYMYFVAKGNGESHFSLTLDEHNRAVNQYQRNQP